MPSPLRESCSCWKAEKLCRHFYRKCWTMDFRDGNLHNATLFCSNAQKSCNITKSFLLQCNSLWQKLPKTLFFQCDLSRNDLLKAENEEKLQLFMSICTDPQMLDQKSNDWRSIFLWLNIVLNLKRK